MQPADIRIDPWTWIPAPAKRSGARALGITDTCRELHRGWKSLDRAAYRRKERCRGSTASDKLRCPDREGSNVTAVARRLKEPRKSPPQPSLAIKGEGLESSTGIVPTREAGKRSRTQASMSQKTNLNPGTADPRARARAPREASADDRSRFRQVIGRVDEMTSKKVKDKRGDIRRATIELCETTCWVASPRKKKKKKKKKKKEGMCADSARCQDPALRL